MRELWKWLTAIAFGLGLLVGFVSGWNWERHDTVKWIGALAEQRQTSSDLILPVQGDCSKGRLADDAQHYRNLAAHLRQHGPHGAGTGR